MKHRVSITIDEDTLLLVRDLLRSKTFRNKSHLVECAIERYLEE